MVKLTMVMVCLAGLFAVGQDIHDGKIFDGGLTREKRGDASPIELERVAGMVGQWDVTWQVPDGKGKIHTAQGKAEINWMNRGYALMERFKVTDFNGLGTPKSTLSFLSFSSVSGTWGYGIADSHQRNVSIYNGGFNQQKLILDNILREGGGMLMTMYRLELSPITDQGFFWQLQSSTNLGGDWSLILKKTYLRHAASPEFMATGKSYGKPAENRPEQAAEFDFLIGEWNAGQDITAPNGQNYKFPSTSTAVYCLDGQGILEYNWYDVNPSFPDSATSIIRLYNPAMRRWESLYLSNRNNSLLYFGGRKEGDRIVLNLFDTHVGRGPYSYFIFHDIGKDHYLWHSERTNDGGKTFVTTWSIDTTRLPQK